MYYKIRESKREELKEGRTIQYISLISKYSRQYMNDILNGKRNITYDCAKTIVKAISKNSFKIANQIKENNIKFVIDYFFEEVE